MAYTVRREFEYKFLYQYSDGITVQIRRDGSYSAISSRSVSLSDYYDLIPLNDAEVQIALGLIPTVKYSGWSTIIKPRLVAVYKFCE